MQYMEFYGCLQAKYYNDDENDCWRNGHNSYTRGKRLINIIDKYHILSSTGLH